ncbi:hypothetical protein KAFR_0F01650 [Kazachstania africana CBS 2517]|uniref:Uncharacterized protein n=1 Tax=Kazachstania africana (strain ATCC 22294 / BCRC 22015 / CBS 2517 / CECT 1963 / NBRC 1671 / NRRL Y-8276) TaxID=1071382 RepID=H2AWL2_KAZAF|nr:hypothetical protein KAFR_0F01650 [Kazachstania africana CBS 2517]CCF58762.1 hypothetical protein KAFR_0F01650 [Kazachstania africana CBS 2517]
MSFNSAFQKRATKSVIQQTLNSVPTELSQSSGSTCDRNGINDSKDFINEDRIIFDPELDKERNRSQDISENSDIGVSTEFLHIPSGEEDEELDILSSWTSSNLPDRASHQPTSIERIDDWCMNNTSLQLLSNNDDFPSGSGPTYISCEFNYLYPVLSSLSESQLQFLKEVTRDVLPMLLLQGRNSTPGLHRFDNIPSMFPQKTLQFNHSLNLMIENNLNLNDNYESIYLTDESLDVISSNLPTRSYAVNRSTWKNLIRNLMKRK